MGCPSPAASRLTRPSPSATGQITLASALPTGPVTLNPVVTASENGVAVTAPLAVTVTHALPPPPPPPPTLTWNPQWVTPASLAAHVGVPLGSLGISVTDPLADGHAGTMALNVSVTKGTLSAKDAAGTFLPGSGTAKLATYRAGFAQTNAVLATLTYTASAAVGDAMSDARRLGPGRPRGEEVPADHDQLTTAGRSSAGRPVSLRIRTWVKSESS
jgi:hypothetical protein